MAFTDFFRQQILALELRFSRLSTPLERLPLLRHLHRGVTADVRLLDAPEGIGIGLSIEFLSPYLHLPVEVKKSQIGIDEAGEEFRPSAFRFFDWHSWTHIDGNIEWCGERRVTANDNDLSVITGFDYRPVDINPYPDNFGLRLAEGVDGTIEVLSNDNVVSARFQPHYWIIAPGNEARRITAIKDTELAMVIVSLSELGTGNPDLYETAIRRIIEWLNFKQQKRSPEITLLTFLIYIRDWGPLGMEPMFGGIKEILNQSRISGVERILFDFYADNWGVRNNKNGRMIAIKILEAFGTKKALFTLMSISDYVRNHAIPPEEMTLIERAINALKENKKVDV